MRRCDVFWTSHGCCLPRGHQPGTFHLCVVSAGDGTVEPCSQIVWWEGKGWMRSDRLDEGGWSEVGYADPFRMTGPLTDAVSLTRVSFDIWDNAKHIPTTPKPWWRRLFDRRKK